MKKFLSLALSVLMLLSLLAGCGGGSSTDDGAQQDGGSETAETGGKLVVYSALNEDNTIAMAEQLKRTPALRSSISPWAAATLWPASRRK